jgi:bifunctional DNA-binding transcriptional regulator/antitoxin component of YhaV-PrlF toxin-antitoxin module
MITSSLLRGIAKVDSGGKIEIPRNILKAMDLKGESIVELKIAGSGRTMKIIMSKRRNYRGR